MALSQVGRDRGLGNCDLVGNQGFKWGVGLCWFVLPFTLLPSATRCGSCGEIGVRGSEEEAQ